MADGDLDATCQDAEDSLERIKRHQAEKSAVKVTERDAYGSVDHVSARALLICCFLLSLVGNDVSADLAILPQSLMQDLP